MTLAAEDYKVDITSDRMEASITLLNEQVRDQIEVESLREALALKGVTQGIDEGRMAAIGQQPVFNKPYLIARGRVHKDGAGETITYKFEVGDESKSEETDSGSIDFRNIKNFTNFKAGQVLAVKTPATPGVPGFSVMGEELKARDGKTINLRIGKGVRLSDDGMTAYADDNGHACVIADRLTVMGTVEVPAHVDYSIGNIKFIGNVKVRGSVRAGFSVEAEGDIEIAGNVEKCIIVCQGNLEIRGIVFGGGECRIEVRGDASIGAIDQTEVKVMGDLQVANYIRHSDIACGGAIEVLGKKGSVVAGDIHAYRGILAPFVGNSMATLTKLTVGTNPLVAHEIEATEAQIATQEDKLRQIRNALTALNARRAAAGGALDAKNNTLFTKLKAAENQLVPLLKPLQDKLEEDTSQSADYKEAKIRVSQIIYPGVIVCFRDRMQYKTRDELQCVAFYEEDAEIRTGPF